MPVIANQERINRFVREYGQDSFFCRGLLAAHGIHIHAADAEKIPAWMRTCCRDSGGLESECTGKSVLRPF